MLNLATTMNKTFIYYIHLSTLKYVADIFVGGTKWELLVQLKNWFYFRYSSL